MMFGDTMSKKILEKLKNDYEAWKTNQIKKKVKYQQLYVDFKNTLLLRDLEEKPLKLYLYICFLARNLTGESWPSKTQISQYFGWDMDVVDKALDELEDLELIQRVSVPEDSRTYICLKPIQENHMEMVMSKKKKSSTNDD